MKSRSGLLIFVISLFLIPMQTVLNQTRIANPWDIIEGDDRIEYLDTKEGESEEKVTTVFIVRHAEKEKQPSNNPPLTLDGEKRAETLACMLSHSGVSVVLTTNTTRTRETVNNYANKKGIKIQTYRTIEDVANLIKTKYMGKTILVAGHSNTVPNIIKTLGINSVPNIDNEYNNLFIITIFSEDLVSLIHLKYEIYDN